ncbi:rRNA maturation RNase YbeY [Synechococcus sp. Nb3U1]|uniref:rRNA maturation RNase YbeY n=1 Tax=Synechococcus sp. Nb3U1 TaxID=1914529 RepID=UPI001F3CAAA2|nr:rRNA maturation RNase YbeY [Synechococcus sp. Nb3U1]MCF2970039.1 rRNA maturation RNase YbeY [Synechococcus sp. Nb3U1]
MDGFLDLYLQFNIPSPIEEATWCDWFEIWLRELGVTIPCELSLCLTSDDHIRELNREFRQIDEPTDVLAFAAQEMLAPVGIREVSGVRLLGDIVISVQTARLQAKAQGHRLSDELAWLATHGLLHLLGWDHPDELSLQRMMQQQRQLLSAIQLGSEVTHGQ